MSGKYDLSLIAPSYNESGNIYRFYDRVHEVFVNSGLRVQIVYVDDGSKDSTLEEIRELCAKDENVKGVRFSRNFGKEAAILAGLQQAEGRYSSIIDCDLQQDPSYVLEMVRIMEENPDVDCVSARQKERLEKGLSAKVKSAFYAVMSKLSEAKTEQDVSDFRTFRSNVKETLLSMPEYFRFSKGLFAWVGFHNVTIDYVVKEREIGVSKWNFFKLLKYAFEGIVAFSVKPLQLSFVLFFLFAASCAVKVVVDIVRAVSGTVVSQISLLFGFLLFVSSLNFLVLGLLGHYLGKEYIQTKNRPVYIVKEIIQKE